MKATSSIAIATLAACSLATSALAGGVWTEEGDFNGAGGSANPIPPFGIGVSGDFDLANETSGSGDLSSIMGSFFNGADNDPYLISITDPGSFSASITVDGETYTPRMSLWSADRLGISAVMDGSLSSDNVTEAGLYYLLIGTDTIFESNALGEIIFSYGALGVEQAPDATTLDFVQSTYISGPGFPAFLNVSYEVSLTGASYAVPAPGTFGALACAGLVMTRRRR